ncbi:aggregation-promoting factor C-terminal-like domain-containing protein [Streptomyces decoyicus]
MSRISVRGFAVASATAVTTVGAVVGVAAGNEPASVGNTEAAAADATIADIPAGAQAQVQTASLTQQADDQSTQADTAALKSAQESARKAAAETAQSKKHAADEAKAKKEADARDKKELAASRSSSRDLGDLVGKSSYTIAETKAIAQQMMAGDQFQCFSNIVDHESGWNYKAVNAGSGAYGLVQALPGSKMSSAGSDWQTNPATQIKWGLNYMNERYDSPCGAWSFWQANSWY